MDEQTPNEREILRLLGLGRSLADVAAILGLQPQTVRALLMRAHRKLHGG